jgi:hypothetical protein
LYEIIGTPEQKTVEEGAVGGINNVETEKPAPRKYRIDRDALSHNSSEEIGKIQQKIFQSNVFKRLGALESSTRNHYFSEFNTRTTSLKIIQLRNSAISHIATISQTGVPYPNDFIQFFASKEYDINHYCHLFLYLCSDSVFVALGFCLYPR